MRLTKRLLAIILAAALLCLCSACTENPPAQRYYLYQGQLVSTNQYSMMVLEQPVELEGENGPIRITSAYGIKNSSQYEIHVFYFYEPENFAALLAENGWYAVGNRQVGSPVAVTAENMKAMQTSGIQDDSGWISGHITLLPEKLKNTVSFQMDGRPVTLEMKRVQTQPYAAYTVTEETEEICVYVCPLEWDGQSQLDVTLIAAQDDVYYYIDEADCRLYNTKGELVPQLEQRMTSNRFLYNEQGIPTQPDFHPLHNSCLPAYGLPNRELAGYTLKLDTQAQASLSLMVEGIPCPELEGTVIEHAGAVITFAEVTSKETADDMTRMTVRGTVKNECFSPDYLYACCIEAEEVQLEAEIQADGSFTMLFALPTEEVDSSVFSLQALNGEKHVQAEVKL